MDLEEQVLNKKCYFSGNNCRALVIEDCPSNCSFFQTPEEAKARKAKANARLRSLPDEKQKAIAEKYYSGEMPWQQ